MTMSGRSTAAAAPAPVRGIALLFALLALLGAVLAVSAATAAPASAATKEEIEEELGFEIFNSRTQRHPGRRTPRPPDRHRVEERRHLLGRRVASQLRRLKIHTPTGFIGNPHVTPKCTLTEFSSTSLPDRLPRSASSSSRARDLRHLLPALQHGDAADQAGLIGLHHAAAHRAGVPRSGLADRQRLRPRRPITSPQLQARHQRGRRPTLWGVPADPKHDKHRFLSPAAKTSAPASTDANGCPGRNLRDGVDSRKGRSCRTRPPAGTELISPRRRRILRRLPSCRRSPSPADDRLPAAELLAELPRQADDRSLGHRRRVST